MVRVSHAGGVGLAAGVLALLIPDTLLNPVLDSLPPVPFPWFTEVLLVLVPVLVVPVGLAAACWALADRQGPGGAVEATVAAGVATGAGWAVALVVTSGDIAVRRGAWYLLVNGIAFAVRGGVAALAGFGLVAVRER